MTSEQKAKTLLLYDYPKSICSQMARLVLEEKGVTYKRRTVDIMKAAEQFEPWYTALNPKAVVPTLKIGDEIVTDTIRIVYRIESEFGGPALVPADAGRAEAMDRMMHNVMGLHYGVLLYSPGHAPGVVSPTIIARGEFLRDQLARHPERSEILQSRIAGNQRMQTILSQPTEVEHHISSARALVGEIDDALAGHDFLCDGQYTLADAFATAALARFQLHGFGVWWTDGARPNVAAYYARAKGRPSWSAAGVVDAS